MFFRWVVRASQRSCQKSQRCHICKAESMTPLCRSQRSQWLRCACHSGVIDSAVHGTAVSMTPLKFFQNLKCIDIPFKGSQSLAKMMSKVTAVSMTPLCTSQRSHWLRCDNNRRLQSRFSRWILIHIEKGFNPCLRGLGELFYAKKPEVENLVSGSL
jgi:hypothetical protein